MKRHALSDHEWSLIKDLAFYKPARGPHPKHVRLMLDGIFWILATGAQWRDLPESYGPWGTVYSRFRTYVDTGILKRIVEKLLQVRKAGKTLKLFLICVDGTYIRAHRHAAGARKKKTGDGKADAENSAREQALGRSRGGFTTKLHVICDAKGTPLAFSLTPGNIHDVRAFDELFATCMGQLREYGWSRQVKLVACDKGYDSERVRALCRANGLEPVIPRRRGPQGQDRSEAGFDRSTYGKRNHVERCIGWLKENRRLSTRYEKLARSYAGMVELAIIRRLLRAA